MPFRPIAPAETSAGIQSASTEDPLSAAIPVPDSPNEQTPIAPEENAPLRRRGHAMRDERGKFMPTSDYPNGFAMPPAQHRFKKGNPGGPGRPKHSMSHDAMLRKELGQKRPVRIDGKSQKLTVRQLLLKTTVKDALAGDKQSRRMILGEISRLYPPDVETVRQPSVAELNDSDALSLAELKAMLLDDQAGEDTVNAKSPHKAERGDRR